MFTSFKVTANLNNIFLFTGGVTSMDVFLKDFFPDVYQKESSVKPSDDQYCKFDSQILTLFTSSLYLAALVSSIGASMATRTYGRRPTMMTSGLLFAAGAIVNGLAKNVVMLIVGRLLLGFGIGCANQVHCSLQESIFFFCYYIYNYLFHEKHSLNGILLSMLD
jgi:MFS family permease